MSTSRRSGRPAEIVIAPRRALCLDFANTLAWRGSTPSESLHGLSDVVQWLMSSSGVLSGVIEDGEGWAQRHPAQAAAIFREALALRETIYRIFHAIAAGGAPADEDLGALTLGLKSAPARSALQRVNGGFGWRLEAAHPGDAPALLAPVLWSAGDLLTASQPGRVRECANDKCLWLFLDESKNGTRRWCSMSACGNRAKAHRHYARVKQS